MTAYDTEEGLTLESKRAAVRRKVTTEAIAIFTWSDDVEPKLLCDAHVARLLPSMDVIEIVHPNAKVSGAGTASDGLPC